MDIPIEYSGFEGRGLILRTAGLLSGPKILIDNQLVIKQQGQYLVRDNRGEQVVIRIKNRFLDPIPNLYIGGNLVELARPLKGHEYLWGGLPVFLLLLGGALGGALGFSAFYLNTQVFRSDQTATAKYLLTGAISLAALVAYVILAGLFQILIRG